MKLTYITLIAVLLYIVEARSYKRQNTAYRVKRDVSKLHSKIRHEDAAHLRPSRSAFRKRDRNSDLSSFGQHDMDMTFDLDDFLNGHGSTDPQSRMDELFRNIFDGFLENRNLPSLPEINDLDTDFGGNNLLSGIFGNRWWKGPNVCLRKEKYELPAEPSPSGDDDDDDEFGDFFSSNFQMTSSQCYSSDHSHKCVLKVTRNGKTVVHENIYECCHGYERGLEDEGCNTKVDLKPLMEALKANNLTVFAKGVRDIEGLEDQMKNGNFTLFVPSDEAMDKGAQTMSIEVVPSESDNLNFMRQLVENHIVPDFMTSSDFMDEEMVMTKNGISNLRFNKFLGRKSLNTVNCARVTKSNIKAENGVIHVVDKMLEPVKQNIAEMIYADPTISSFTNLISSKSREMLEDPEAHYTVFAFNNDAFDALPDDIKNQIRKNDTCIRDLLKEHLIPHTICSAAIRGHAVIQNEAGRYLNATRDPLDESIIIEDDGEVVAADRMATNGVIHVISKVLLNEKMLETFAALKAGDGKGFAEYAETTGAEDDIKETPEVTVFVPRGKSLKQLSNELDSASMKKLLMNHVVEGKKVLSLRDESQALTTLAGRKLGISVRPSYALSLRRMSNNFRASVGCANVVRANVPTCNGMIHYIDQPIITPTKTVMEVLQSTDSFSQFLMMLQASGQDTILTNNNFTGTVVVPNDEAFEDHFDSAELDQLFNNDEDLKHFVKSHLFETPFCCNSLGGDLSFHGSLRSLGGGRVSTFGIGHQKTIGGAKVVGCDSMAKNGIVHQLDRPVRIQPNNPFESFFSRNLNRNRNRFSSRRGSSEDDDNDFELGDLFGF